MRLVSAVLAVTASIAHADPWTERAAGDVLQPLARLTESCEIDVQFRGAVVEGELRQHLANTAAVPIAALGELALPANARLVGFAVQHDHGVFEQALVVPSRMTTEHVTSDQVLGADPALVTALPDDRFRILLQPLEPESELTVITRWTTLADIHGGALHVVLPGGEHCRGTVHASAGPGASIARILVDNQPVSNHATAPLVLGATDTDLAAELRFKSTRPLVWTQTEPAGDGTSAQAITIVAPSPKLAPRRVVFVVDGSRSMELVGAHVVKRVVATIAKSLPAGTELDAIVFDRTPTRVHGKLEAIEQAIDDHHGGSGSDAAAAFAVAHEIIGNGPAAIVLVTDGVLGEQPPTALAQALASTPAAVDVHAIVLSPGRMHDPSGELLRTTVATYGGSYTEIPLAALDAALARFQLAPAWLDLAAPGLALPPQLAAGTGITRTRVGAHLAKIELVARQDKPIKIAAVAAGAASIAELADAPRRPSVDDGHAFAVLASAGKVAKNRRAMVAGGGPYTRMIEIDDPPLLPILRTGQATVSGGSALDRETLQRLFRVNLQPAAFACYQRALARAPTLAGTAQFRLEIGRGELTRATIAGFGDAAFDACLADAAYQITPPLPNPDYNVDDRTLVNYPLTFSVRENKPLVIPGDADSSSPLDIEAIQGGPPRVIHPGDTSTPLGNLRPH